MLFQHATGGAATQNYISAYGNRCNTTLRLTLASSVCKRSKYTPELNHDPVSDRPFHTTVFAPATAVKQSTHSTNTTRFATNPFAPRTLTV